VTLSERWVCRRCFADNEASAESCVRCGLGRFADPSSAGPADRRDPVTGQPLPSWPGSASVPPSTPAWQRLLRFWWVAAIVVVLAVGWFTAARRGGNGQINDSGTLSVTDLQVGDCFNNSASTEVSQVDAVPCAEPHQYELFHVFRLGGTAYPTTSDLDSQSAAACTPAFAAYVGHDYETSTLYISTLYPTSDGWSHGDREVQCVVHNDAESKVTGSVRGTAR
jgi:hypothetical protein